MAGSTQATREWEKKRNYMPFVGENTHTHNTYSKNVMNKIRRE